MNVKVIGCSHCNTTIEVRERLAFSAEQARTALDELKRQYPHVETVLVSTCNRTELYAATENAAVPSRRQVAEFLAERGKRVTVIEMLGDIARDMEPITRKLTLKRIEELPIDILTDTTLERVDAGRAVVQGPDGKRDLGPFDSTVVAVGTQSNEELAKPLLARGIEVHVVGDAAELGQIIGAVRSAWEVARRI